MFNMLKFTQVILSFRYMGLAPLDERLTLKGVYIINFFEKSSSVDSIRNQMGVWKTDKLTN